MLVTVVLGCEGESSVEVLGEAGVTRQTHEHRLAFEGLSIELAFFEKVDESTLLVLLDLGVVHLHATEEQKGAGHVPLDSSELLTDLLAGLNLVH